MKNTNPDIFIPKYLFAAYLLPLVYGCVSIVLLFITIQRQSLDWTLILFAIFSGVNTYQNAKDIIKEVEFDERKMIIRYYLFGTKTIAYEDIDVNVGFHIKGERVVIPFKHMTNKMYLQERVVQILRKKNIKNINIDEIIKERKHALVKSLNYALLIPLILGGLASFVVHADIESWAYLLFGTFILFFIALITFFRFGKP